MAKIVGAAAIRNFLQGGGSRDLVIAWIAGQQLGLITIGQLKVAALTRGEIAGLLLRGNLHRLHRGVYVVGHRALLPGARELAAVLACGRTAVVSHRSAAGWLGLVDQPTVDVEVTVVGRKCRSRDGICVRRVEQLHPLDHGFVRGIPSTSPARTIIDFAAMASGYEVERAIAEAYARELLTEEDLYAAIDRAQNRPGVAAIRAELRREAGPQWTQSEGERRMLKLIRAAGLPMPHTQVPIAGWPADFLWAEQRLIVEVDGYRFHRSRAAFERDRRRDQAHIAAGYTVIRVTWRQLTEEPLRVVATIARALGI